MIIRSEKKDNFTQISNELINNNVMSGLSKSILIYCLSKPDDWNFYMGDIKNHFSDSDYSIEKSIKELEKLGYIERKKKKTSEKFVWEWTIYEESIVKSIDIDNTISHKLTYGISNDSSDNKNHSTANVVNPIDSTTSQFQSGGFSDSLNPDSLDVDNIVILTSSNTKLNNSKRLILSGDATKLEKSDLLGNKVLLLYYQLYQEKMNKVHDKVYKVREKQISEYIDEISSKHNINLDMWEKMIRYYMFTARFKIKVDYNINHFMSNGILEVYLERELKHPVAI